MTPYDAHTHLDFPGVDVSVLPAAGRCIAGADPVHWERVRATAARWGAHYALGIHPWFDADPACLDDLGEPDALGEIGLDRLRSHPRQARLAALQLERAEGRPVVLHCVRAHAELLALVKRFEVCRGLVHAWSGSAELAMRFVDQGFHISFGPLLARSAKVQRAARAVPTERLLVETDGETTLALQQLPAVIEALAQARQSSSEEMLLHTARNAAQLFPRAA